MKQLQQILISRERLGLVGDGFCSPKRVLRGRQSAGTAVAVAIMSNRITEEQVQKVVTWAQRLANGKVTLILDGDENGRDGAKESLWRTSQETLVRTIVLSRKQQAESLAYEQWHSMHKSKIKA